MRMILEAYYEPRFRDSSHGFRPNRGCHTALRAISHTWTGTTWLIEGDIKGCFDNIDHDNLLNILKRDIHDNRFIKLVKSMLKAGYLEDWKYNQTYSGTAQGGIISPILSNIMLNELDSWIEDTLIPKYTKGKRRSRSDEYNKAQYAVKKARAQGDRQAYRKAKKWQQSIPSLDMHDSNYRRLRYVRYADDFILGFNGPYKEALQIKREIADFTATLGLKLSMEKTKVTHARSERARFLGYEIGVSQRDAKHGGKHRRRSINGAIRLNVPRDVVQKYVKQYSKNGKPTHRTTLYRSSDYEIIATIGAELRGIANYYMMAVDVGKKISKVYWYGKECARKTIAQKYRLTKRESYIKYVHRSDNSDEWSHLRVTIHRKGKRPLIAKCGETPLRIDKTVRLPDVIPAFRIVGTKSELVKRLLADKCELCDEEGPTQAHHVNKLANIKKRYAGKKNAPSWVRWMISRNRKTIMVCPQCHNDITYGRYDGPKIG